MRADLPDSSQNDCAPLRLALRSREAAKAIGISERLLWTLTQDGKVPHKRISAAVIVYPVDALRAWLAGQVPTVAVSTGDAASQPHKKGEDA